jgi:protein-tyrosine phosphatase
VRPPTTESEWVTRRLLLGKYPGARIESNARSKINALIDAGVTTFVDLTLSGELLPYAHLLPAGVAHCRVPITDVTAPSAEQVRAALDAIESATENGVVYVHCLGGCGRTGVIVGCYLVEHGSRPDEALERVQELTRGLQTKPCPETSAQRVTVRRWTTRATWS